MEELIAELKKRIDFKDTLDPRDVVLIAAEDPQMLAFAVVTDISRDLSRRDEWWHVKMQMLSVPLQAMTWTLRMEQMCGFETFTMGGKKRFMAPVRIACGDVVDKPPVTDSLQSNSKNNRSAGLRIVK
jgi:hypothetical protein